MCKDGNNMKSLEEKIFKRIIEINYLVNTTQEMVRTALLTNSDLLYQNRGISFSFNLQCLENLQGRFSSAGIYIGGCSSIVVHEIWNSIHCESHFPAFR